MADSYRVLLVDREWARHRLVASTIHERFPQVAVYCAQSADRAREWLSSIRFDLVLVEEGLEAVADGPLLGPPDIAPPPVVVLELAGAVVAGPDDTRAMSPAADEITQLVEKHLRR